MKRLWVLGIAALLAACGTTAETAAPSTVTETMTVATTVTETVTSEVTVEPTTEDAMTTTASAADAAACRQIARAAESSGLRGLADQLIAGGDPSPRDVLTASSKFVDDLGTAPTEASQDILISLLGVVTAVGEMNDNFEDMFSETSSETSDRIASNLRDSFAMLDESCHAF